MRTRPSNDPVERKLYAHLQFGKRKTSEDATESNLAARDPGGDSDNDEDLESKTRISCKEDSYYSTYLFNN